MLCHNTFFSDSWRFLKIIIVGGETDHDEMSSSVPANSLGSVSRIICSLSSDASVWHFHGHRTLTGQAEKGQTGAKTGLHLVELFWWSWGILTDTGVSDPSCLKAGGTYCLKTFWPAWSVCFLSHQSTLLWTLHQGPWKSWQCMLVSR